jgi:hypothetical protein
MMAVSYNAVRKNKTLGQYVEEKEEEKTDS